MSNNLSYLFDTLGGQSEVARGLQVSRQAVSQWHKYGLPNDIKRLAQLDKLVKDQGFNLVEEQTLTRIIWAKANV